ncbi:TRAP transporter substrate-binding protein [Chloroflexota bacterium]
MKKSISLILTIAVLTSVLTISGCSQPSETVSWKLAAYRAPTHVITQEWDVFAEKINERTNGKLQITVFPGGSLLDRQAQFTGVVDNIAELSSTVGAYHGGQVPLVGAQDLPFSYSTYGGALDTIRGGLGELQAAEYVSFGLAPLIFFPAGRIDIFTNFPVKTPADLAGKLIRGAGGMQLSFMEKCGASPVAMPSGDVYMAMQTGTIDGFFITDTTFVANRLYEVTDYATLVPIMIPLSVILMNSASYDALPSKIQKILYETAEESADALVGIVETGDLAAQDKMRSEGMTVTQLSAAEVAPFKELGMLTWDEFVQKNPDTSAPQMLEIIKKYAK